MLHAMASIEEVRLPEEQCIEVPIKTIDDLSLIFGESRQLKKKKFRFGRDIGNTLLRAMAPDINCDLYDTAAR
jgi:hypothetical protein